MFNNVYAKNFPTNFTEEDVKSVFSSFGRIERMMFGSNDKGQFAFICYASDDKTDREYGPLCAMRAVEVLHDSDRVGGQEVPEGKKFYVREALKKNEREAERLLQSIKYKSSKKRCNLYVRGFREDISEEQLRDLFEPFGEIESIKMHPPTEPKKQYAFVCFKMPDQAIVAKEKLHGRSLGDRSLCVNHYEIKEVREIMNESQRDKHDFQTFRA